MQEFTPNSPLAEDFILGKSVSSHNGIVCCPAIKKGTDKRYIIKTISVPASQVQLDALLLTGAFSEPAAALEYYREQAEAIRDEAVLLEQLFKQEGFLPYESWQLSAAGGERLCYEISLAGTFKKSLERYLRSTSITHLEAVNLGLDLCAALACARRSGYLYIDLKPSNIYISEDKEYKIGDLGFTRLSTLPFTSMPEKYVSAYTAPELRDAMEVINETADTYSVGMILYRVFNNGKLPPKSRDWSEVLPKPCNADDEIYGIIQKACSPIPEDRWETPTEMGQALVAYMQGNVINDVSLTDPETFAQTGVLPAITQKLPAVEVLAQTNQSVSVTDATMVFQAAQAAVSVPEQESMPVQNEVQTQSADVPAAEDAPAADAEASQMPQDAEPLPVIPELQDLFTIPEPEDLPEIPELSPAQPNVSKEGLRNLAQAQKPAAVRLAQTSLDIPEEKPKHHFWKPLLIVILVLAILGGIGYGGFWYYQNQYLQHIDDLVLEGSGGNLTVTVTTSMDPSLLEIVCSDAYGSSVRKPLVNGKAEFTDLNSGSLYNINVESIGKNKLSGKTYDIFTTANSTKIVSLTSVIGSEDGSVILNLTVDGMEPAGWIATCTADGEATVEQSFTGHTATIRGLTVGKEYTLNLAASDGTELTGTTRTTVTGSAVILADDLEIVSNGGMELTITWTIPENANIPFWNVRCYSDAYDRKISVTDPVAVFEEVDTSVAYTVEVTADGMTQSARTTITANPINIRSFAMDESDPDKLVLSWEYDGRAPSGGWLVSYTIGGSSTPNVVKSEEPSVTISTVIPGSTYNCTVQAADNTSIFGNYYTYETAPGHIFNAHGVNAEKVEIAVIERPEDGWLADDVDDAEFGKTIPSGKKLSVVVKSNMNFYLKQATVKARYLFRDETGSVLLNLIGEEDVDWNTMWFDGDYHLGELNVPTYPTASGKYALDVYFDGALFGSAQFTIG